jgi:ribose 5-phosphate isomerase B
MAVLRIELEKKEKERTLNLTNVNIMKQLIGMAADHAGYSLKEELKPMLMQMGYEIKDFGTHSEESMDYPDVAHPLAEAVENGEVAFGIAMCGSANGISMALNKHQGVRAAICWKPELATLARQHNDANVLSMPARFISVEEAKEIVKAYCQANFEGGRHLRRVEKIACK